LFACLALISLTAMLPAICTCLQHESMIIIDITDKLSHLLHRAHGPIVVNEKGIHRRYERAIEAMDEYFINCFILIAHP
jgi:hypothetical protein